MTSPALGVFRRAVAHGRFEAVRALRSRGTALALTLFLLLHALGRSQVDHGDDLFATGFLLAFALGFRPRLSEDRELSFDRLLLLHGLTVAEYAAGKLLGMLAWTFTLASGTCVLATLLSGGDLRFASWYSLYLLLVALAAFPFVALVDLFLKVRVPAAVFLILVFAVVFALVAAGVDPFSIQAFLGLQTSRFELWTLVPLFVRALIALAAMPAVLLVGAWLRKIPSRDRQPRSPPPSTRTRVALR